MQIPRFSHKGCLFYCNTFKGRLSSASKEEEHSSNDLEDEEVVVSTIRTRAMEAKLRRKNNFTTDSFNWVLPPNIEVFIAPEHEKPGEKNKEDIEVDDEKEDFFSVRSCLSRSSSATSMEAFLSVKPIFSRCSSLNGIDFPDFQKRSVIQEFRHCDGWPFGLSRKAELLPPLPKCPSESWSWRKGTTLIRMP